MRLGETQAQRTTGCGSYRTVRVLREISCPDCASRTTRVSLVVNPGAPFDAEQPLPVGRVIIFGAVYLLRSPGIDSTTTALVPQMRTVIDEPVPMASIRIPVSAGALNFRSIAPSYTVASRAAG